MRATAVFLFFLFHVKRFLCLSGKEANQESGRLCGQKSPRQPFSPHGNAFFGSGSFSFLGRGGIVVAEKFRPGQRYGGADRARMGHGVWGIARKGRARQKERKAGANSKERVKNGKNSGVR